MKSQAARNNKRPHGAGTAPCGLLSASHNDSPPRIRDSPQHILQRPSPAASGDCMLRRPIPRYCPFRRLILASGSQYFHIWSRLYLIDKDIQFVENDKPKLHNCQWLRLKISAYMIVCNLPRKCLRLTRKFNAGGCAFLTRCGIVLHRLGDLYDAMVDLFNS